MFLTPWAVDERGCRVSDGRFGALTPRHLRQLLETENSN